VKSRPVAFEAIVDPAGNNAQKSLSVAQGIIAHVRADRFIGSLLDVGCGAGSLLAAASPYASELTGVDSSEFFLTKARASLPSARLFCGDAANLIGLADATFDTVTFCDVIEHLANPGLAIAELRRVLKQDGRLVITTPNADSILRVVLGKRWNGLADKTHILLFTALTLRVFIERSGFRVTRLRTLSGPYLPVPLQRIMDGIRQGGTLYLVAEKLDRSEEF
jgi:SAM-dependent methyltransferase